MASRNAPTAHRASWGARMLDRRLPNVRAQYVLWCPAPDLCGKWSRAKGLDLWIQKLPC